MFTVKKELLRDSVQSLEEGIFVLELVEDILNKSKADDGDLQQRYDKYSSAFYKRNGEGMKEESEKVFEAQLEEDMKTLKLLPDVILNTISDLRAFRLGILSEATKKLLERYFHCKEKGVRKFKRRITNI